MKIEGVCRQRMYAAYFTEVLLPWVKKAVAPYTVEAKRVQYLGGVTAWGVVVVNAEEEAKDAKDGEA